MISILRLFYLIIILFRYRIWRVFKENTYASGIRLAKALEVMGPSFIKLGQTLSTRPDLIGSKVAQALEILQDKLPPFNYKYVERIFLKEFGRKPEYFFKEFNKDAIAAASIAQVHKAISYSGKIYAVKILRPNIDKTIEKDIAFFKWCATLLERYFKSSKRLKPKDVIETFAETLRFELDLRMEAAAASELKDNLKNDEGIKIPEVNWDITSKRILCTEWVEGIPINNIELLKEKNYDLKKIASNLAVNFFNQAYRDGFFHGDMHPGNLFVDSEYNIVLVDFGIMGRIDRETRIYFAKIIKGFLDRDYLEVARIHFQAGYVPKKKSLHTFAQACRSIGEPIVGLPSNKISIGKLLTQLFDITREFEMETQTQLLLLQKSIVLVEGVGSMLDPEVNLWSLADPWIETWIIENLGPEAQLRDGLFQVGKFLKYLPDILEHLAEKYGKEKTYNHN